ncbi:UNKNOWN [Stylonychia lemnae]|uniref:Uncharacterized protein n=1 Tax=Stylonychia lemnae TaxID=5949 RepID=A0A078A9C0_STYLE|nr:UNKNOWN [Stylonychia lemnae]|eukprot:CDW78187.1 UNKNOWN [Stylonychia lemnae]
MGEPVQHKQQSDKIPNKKQRSKSRNNKSKEKTKQGRSKEDKNIKKSDEEQNDGAAEKQRAQQNNLQIMVPDSSEKLEPYLLIEYNFVENLTYERCQEYIDIKSSCHFVQQRGKQFSGDAKFASISQMKMNSPSTRKDDLINMFYMLVYLTNLDLPWCDYLFCMPCNSQQKTFRMVLQKKQETTLSKLAKLYQLPEEFQIIGNEIELMKFNSYPNYTMIQKHFKAIIDKEKPNQQVFKWRRQQINDQKWYAKVLSGIEQLLINQSDFDSQSVNNLESKEIELSMRIDNFQRNEDKYKTQQNEPLRVSTFNYHKHLYDESHVSETILNKTDHTSNNISQNRTINNLMQKTQKSQIFTSKLTDDNIQKRQERLDSSNCQ